MSIDVEIGTEEATFRVVPAYGRTVTFEVRFRRCDVAKDRRWGRRNVQERFVVGLKGSAGDGFAGYVTFEKACGAALARARRYERAYAKPRGLEARAAA